MKSTMMDFPLTLPHILERAGSLFPNSEIVSRLPDKSLHRYTYTDFYQRARALAEALSPGTITSAPARIVAASMAETIFSIVAPNPVPFREHCRSLAGP